METEIGKNYNDLANLHNDAASAHLHAAEAYGTVRQWKGKGRGITDAGRIALELGKDALRWSQKVVDEEQAKVNQVNERTIEIVQDAKLALGKTSATDIENLHYKCRDAHARMSRHFAILEGEEDVRFHLGKASDVEATLNYHKDTATQIINHVDSLKQIDRVPLMETPEFEEFAARVGNYDWCGSPPDDRWCEYVEPELSGVTNYLAKECGLEIPSIEDENREEERSAIFSLAEAAYIAYLYQSTNPE